MRILQVTGLISNKYGAFERWMVSLAGHCAERGHELHCVWEADLVSEQAAADLKARGAVSWVMPSAGRYFRFFGWLLRWLGRHPTDVVHTHFGPACYGGIVAAKLAGVPVLVQLLQSGLHWWKHARGMSRKSRVLMTLPTSVPCRIFTSSRAILEDFRRAGIRNCKIQVAYVGIAPPEPKRGRAEVRREFALRDDDFVVACVAFHDTVKGLDNLLRAVQVLAPKLPRLRVLQIGGEAAPGGTAELKKLAQDLRIENRVVWTGLRNDVADLLSSADMYCQPSRSEGLGLAILEAMASGLPVAATRVGGIPEVVIDGRTGLLTEPESVESLAAALGTLARDPDLRRRMGREGRSYALSKFQVDVQTREMVETYEQLLATIRE